MRTKSFACHCPAPPLLHLLLICFSSSPLLLTPPYIPNIYPLTHRIKRSSSSNSHARLTLHTHTYIPKHCFFHPYFSGRFTAIRGFFLGFSSVYFHVSTNTILLICHRFISFDNSKTSSLHSNTTPLPHPITRSPSTTINKSPH